MPAYDYKCRDCENVFEVVRSISDASDVACPACGGATKRVFTPVGVHFKGSGFYNTDSRGASSSTSSGSKEPAEKAGSCPASSAGCAGCPAAE